MGTMENSKVHGGTSAGSALSWTVAAGVIELALHRAPCNELGSESLVELENWLKQE